MSNLCTTAPEGTVRGKARGITALDSSLLWKKFRYCEILRQRSVGHCRLVLS